MPDGRYRIRGVMDEISKIGQHELAVEQTFRQTSTPPTLFCSGSDTSNRVEASMPPLGLTPCDRGSDPYCNGGGGEFITLDKVGGSWLATSGSFNTPLTCTNIMVSTSCQGTIEDHGSKATSSYVLSSAGTLSVEIREHYDCSCATQFGSTRITEGHDRDFRLQLADLVPQVIAFPQTIGKLVRIRDSYLHDATDDTCRTQSDETLLGSATAAAWIDLEAYFNGGAPNPDPDPATLQWIGPAPGGGVAGTADAIRLVDPQLAASWPDGPFKPNIDWKDLLPTKIGTARGIAVDRTTLGVIAFESTLPAAVTITVVRGTLLGFDAFDPRYPTSYGGLGQKSSEVIPKKNELDGRYHALVLYRPPYSIPDGGVIGLQETVTVSQAGLSSTPSRQFKLVQPPLLLVHGLWSNGAAWKEFQDYLSERYSAPVVGLVDYAQFSAESFTNLSVQKRFADRIRSALREARELGYVVSRLDVVGHSMGGLVAKYRMGSAADYRNPSNYQKGEISRLITVGTPHCGTLLATLLVALANHLPDPNSLMGLYTGLTLKEAARRPWLEGGLLPALGGFRPVLGPIDEGAVDDLAELSSAIQDLPAASMLADSQVAELQGSAPSGFDPVKTFLNLILGSWGLGVKPTVDSVLGVGHDTIVGAASQIADGAGSCSSPTADTVAIQDVVHAGGTWPFALSETKSPAVFDALLWRLTQGSFTGWQPASPPGATSPPSPAPTTAVPLEQVDFATLTRLDASILNVSPPGGSVVSAFSPTLLQVSASSHALSRLVVMNEGALTDQTTAPFQASLAPRMAGATVVRVLALFADNTYVATEVNYTSNPGVPLMLVPQDSILLTGVGAESFVPAVALYANGSLDVRNSATYSVTSGAEYVELLPGGVVRGKSPGHAQVTITFGSKTQSVEVDYVVPATTSCSLTGDDSDLDGIPNTVEATEGTNPCVKDNDVFTNARLFAMQQYRDFLGREGDAFGVSYWSAAIGSGTSRATVTKSYFDSPEFQGAIAPVTRLYFAYFNRIPDEPGLDYWIYQYRAGMSLNSISQAFAGSAEFIGTYGSLDNAAFVTLVYQNVLGRAPDAPGLAYWAAQLNGGFMTRGQVMVGFSESAEYQQSSYNRVFVTMTYYGMLRRMPEQAGFDYWVGQLNAGSSALNLINGFLGAVEYRARFLP